MNREIKAAVCMFIFFISFILSIAFSVLKLPTAIITITIVLGTSAFIYFYMYFIVPGTNYNGNPDILFENANEISKSGAQIISTWCDGDFIFNVTFGVIPTLKISLYPTGMVIKPLFLKAFGLHYNEITKIEHVKGSLTRIAIYHTSNNVRNPLVLYISIGTNKLIRRLEEQIS